MKYSLFYPQHPSQLKIICEGEHSDVTKAIDDISLQIGIHYNKERLYLVQTVQNYLNNTDQVLKLHLDIAKRYYLFVGVNLVDGCYRVQEGKKGEKKK